jgi:hypothetical protein
VITPQLVHQAGTFKGIPQLLLGARKYQFNTCLTQSFSQHAQHFFTGCVD